MKDITRHYGNLKADERLKVVIDAMSRGDWLEVGRLGDTCPKIVYMAQRDIAFTEKYLNLQTVVYFHAVFFWKMQHLMLAAILTKNEDVLLQAGENLLAMQEAWTRFCAYAGFDADTLLLAFGFTLDNMPRGDIKLNEVMIEEMYQAYLRMSE